VTARNGDGPDGAVGAIEAGRVVVQSSVNTRLIAENSAHSQDKTADTSVVATVPRGEPVTTHRPFRFHRRIYEWRQSRSLWELVTAGQITARVVPDAVHTAMYRVDLGDGGLSDMVNLTRAKDAAVSLADRAIETGRLLLPGGPPMRGIAPAVLDQPSPPPSHPGEARP
jgi:hypothetical protein